jgi:hypothetical protein
MYINTGNILILKIILLKILSIYYYSNQGINSNNIIYKLINDKLFKGQTYQFMQKN